jgi:hypothetical protein
MCLSADNATQEVAMDSSEVKEGGGANLAGGKVAARTLTQVKYSKEMEKCVNGSRQ